MTSLIAIMKHSIITALLLSCALPAFAWIVDPDKDPKWTRWIRNQPDEWFVTDEAKEIAENVLLYQKDAGGWPKNIPMHYRMTPEEKIRVAGEKNSEEAAKKSCFDNDATTTEVRFLARMYKAVPDSRYREAFDRGVALLLDCQYPNAEAPDARPGGWPQYYPLRGGYSDFITFNDNLTVNNLQLMKEISERSGDFSDIVSDEIASRARKAYEAGIQLILDCQIVEDGVKTFWCAQHDPYTLLPVYGRPHELPSYSAMEGTAIMFLLMDIENPSPEVQEAIHAGMAFLKRTRIADKEKVEVLDADGKRVDEKIVDAPGKGLWGRFIQLGGDVAEKAYERLFNDLAHHNHKYQYGDTVLKYSEERNARASYDPSKAHQPIYSIYDKNLPYLLYRFLYSFDDLPATAEEQHGLVLPVSSLNAERRCRYNYISDWPEKLLVKYYPAWLKKNHLTAPDEK